MRIVFATDCYSEGMGYSENILPRVLAALGHEVFIVSSTMQVYGDCQFYDQVYQDFLGHSVVAEGQQVIDGVTLIRLPILLWWKRFKIAKGKTRLILALKPDIVYAWDPRAYQTVMLSLVSYFSSFKLFSAIHTVASVYPAYYSFQDWSFLKRIYLRLTDTLLGWIASRRISMCYATTPDAVDIGVRFFGLSQKHIKRLPLGLDTNLFFPCRVKTDYIQRVKLRSELGIELHEIVCIYTGRLTEGKNPYCLALAIEALRKEGYSFRAIFLGAGEQGEKIAVTDGCLLKSFIPYSKLRVYYHAADIGVWPCQESISMMDAAACGLPIVVSNRMMSIERIEGNGLTYEENDYLDLARVLRQLEDIQLRIKLGNCGADKMRNTFDITHVADIILNDFKSAFSHTAPAKRVA